MEKYLSPLRNTETECEKPLVEKNTSTETILNDVDLEIVHEIKIEKTFTAVQVMDNKASKIKKSKIKRNRGEKRQFPYKADSIKKFKRKKKEEKSANSSKENNLTDRNNEIEILPSEVTAFSTPQGKSVLKKEGCTTAENDSDVENSGKPIKHRTSRKSKAVAIKCKETFGVLLELSSDILDSMDKSLKIIKSHNLLNDKLISIDILLDLISLAMESNKSEVGDSEKELSLLMIISKCLSDLSTTPKKPKARQSLMTVPLSPNNNKSQEEVVPTSEVVPVSKEEVMEVETPKNQESDETMEQSETNANLELPEKSQEPTVEKSGKNFCITNYFKKLKKTVEERDKNERFSCFAMKTDMFLAPKLGGELTGERREKFEQDFTSQNSQLDYLNGKSYKSKRVKKFLPSAEKSNPTVEEATPQNTVFESPVEVSKPEPTAIRKRVSLIRVDKPKTELNESVCRTKAKLFQFHDNRRPPYWGTWRRKSESVKGRRPFGRDKLFNYEVDSDDEWEEEEEPGESLHGSDDEREPEEDYEVDNDFFVPHGYLSDDENPEKENLPQKTKLDLLEEQFTSEQKQKTRQMTPIVFGTFWVHQGLPTEGTLYHDLQIEKLRYVPWTTIPIEIEEEEKKTENPPEQAEPGSQVKKSKQKFFPNEEIPNLIKMIHGSPQNSDQLAKKFLLYWETEKIPDGNRPGLTKVCVQKKIKELAAWQQGHERGKMCWQVPKETREEFGAEVENKTPEKKPRKCFFWKFVRKAEKTPGGTEGNSPSPASAPAREPEVVIIESGA